MVYAWYMVYADFYGIPLAGRDSLVRSFAEKRESPVAHSEDPTVSILGK